MGANNHYARMLEGYRLDESALEAIALGVATDQPVLLFGPPSTGKTTAPVAAAHVLGMRAEIIDLGAMVEKDDLFGVWQAVEGTTHYAPSPLARAIRQPETIVILDEIMRLKPFAANGLLSLLDSRRTLALPNGELVLVHETVRFVATANEDAAGQFEIPEALADRLVIRYRFTWPTFDVEVEILTSWGFGLGEATFLARIAGNLRENWYKSRVTWAPGLRAMRTIYKLRETGIGLERSLDFVIKPRLAGEREIAILEEAVVAYRPMLTESRTQDSTSIKTKPLRTIGGPYFGSSPSPSAVDPEQMERLWTQFWAENRKLMEEEKTEE